MSNTCPTASVTPPPVPACWRPLPDGPLPIPIEDKGIVLALLSNGYIRSTHFSHLQDRFRNEDGGYSVVPTHWMPLPKSQPVYGVSHCEHEKVKADNIKLRNEACYAGGELFILKKELADAKALHELDQQLDHNLIVALRAELADAKLNARIPSQAHLDAAYCEIDAAQEALAKSEQEHKRTRSRLFQSEVERCFLSSNLKSANERAESWQKIHCGS